MLPDPIKIMGFMSPGVMWGGGLVGQKRSLQLISFVSSLISAGISTLWVYSTCCHAGNIAAHLNAKWIPQQLSVVRLEAERRFWVSSQRGSQDKGETLCSQQKGCSVSIMVRKRRTERGREIERERERELNLSPQQSSCWIMFQTLWLYSYQIHPWSFAVLSDLRKGRTENYVKKSRWTTPITKDIEFTIVATLF